MSELTPVPLIDAHAHFVDPQRPEGVIWPAEAAPYYGRKRVQEYAQEMESDDLHGVIAVETSRRDCDDAYLREISRNNDLILGYIANLAPDTPSFEPRLAKHCQEKKFKGVRLRPISRFDLSSNLVVQICETLAAHNAIIELGLKSHTRLPALYALAEKIPDAKFVLVHAGHPLFENGELTPGWKKSFSNNSPPENVWCKVTTNFGVYICPSSVGSEDSLRNLCLDAILKSFPMDRILWGSNWPVANAQQAHNFRRALQESVSASDVDKILYQNSRTLYAA